MMLCLMSLNLIWSSAVSSEDEYDTVCLSDKALCDALYLITLYLIWWNCTWHIIFDLLTLMLNLMMLHLLHCVWCCCVFYIVLNVKSDLLCLMFRWCTVFFMSLLNIWSDDSVSDTLYLVIAVSSTLYPIIAHIMIMLISSPISL